jgi:hypothetical protein
MSSSTSLGFSEFQSGSGSGSNGSSAPVVANSPESKISKMKQRLKASEAKVSKKVDMEYENDDIDMSDAEEQAHLSSFQPPPLPMIQQKKRPSGHKQQPGGQVGSESSGDEAVTRENFDQMSSAYAKQYYDQYLPSSTSGMNHIKKLLGATPGLVEDNSGGGGEGGESALMKKLNYMIHLLEDQKDEKVNGITEELVLYCFLGIFIIFVLDSFVRVGKYIR